MTIADLLGILRKHIITIAVTFAVILGVDILEWESVIHG